MATNLTLIGTVATEPVSHKFDNGVLKCYFRLAVNERKRDRETGDWYDAPTQWFTINAYRGLAENALGSIAKGERVVVTGRLNVRYWESVDGKSGTALEIEAEGLGHDLKWGTTKYTRTAGLRPVGSIDMLNDTADSSDNDIRLAA